MGRWYFCCKSPSLSYVHIVNSPARLSSSTISHGQNNQRPLTTLTQGGDGSRQPTSKELDLAQKQGEAFYQAVSKVNFA